MAALWRVSLSVVCRVAREVQVLVACAVACAARGGRGGLGSAGAASRVARARGAQMLGCRRCAYTRTV
jgi:hypothetical protein